MANLSDLAASMVDIAPPEWISALAGSDLDVQSWPVGAGGADGGANGDGENAAGDNSDPLVEAYERGVAEGLVQAEQAGHADRQAAAGLKLAFGRLEQAATEAVRQKLITSVSELCVELVMPEQLDKQALNRRCEQISAAIGQAPSRCTMHLHPDDLALIDADCIQSMTIRTDPEIERGSLRLVSPEGEICDGPEAWRQAIAEAFN